MTINKNTKLADAVLNHPFLINIIERFDIKLGFGEKTISEVCAEYKINEDLFLRIIELHFDDLYYENIMLQKSDIAFVVKYLLNSHRYYVNEVLPYISGLIKELLEKNNDMSLLLVEKFFNQYIREVEKHLEYEEKKVYPYILSIVNNNASDLYSISEYKNNHDDIETKLFDLKNLLIRHLPQKHDQKYRRNILLSLFRFEKDLKIHTVIEEQILVPYIDKIENKQ